MMPIMHVCISAMSPTVQLYILSGQFSLLSGIGVFSLVKTRTATRSLHDALKEEAVSRLCCIS